MLKHLLLFFKKGSSWPLDRATQVLSEAVAMLPPELRFKALKIVTEQTFPEYRIYKFHPCTKKQSKKLIGLSGDE